MTVKDIAKMVSKTERAIQKWVNKASELSSSINEKCSLSSSSKPANFTIDETILILKCGRTSEFIIDALINETKRSDEQNTLVENSISLIVSETIKGLVPIFQSMITENNKAILQTINKQSDTKAIPYRSLSIDPRNEIREIIAKYAKKHTNPNNPDYRGTWHLYFNKCYYHLGINAQVQAKNRQCQPLDVLLEKDTDGALTIARQFFMEN